MSQNTNNIGPWQVINKAISPRENVKAVSVAENIGTVLRNTWNLAKSIVGTTVDLPLGVAEAGIALPNNIIGYATTLVDKAVVQSINSVRSKINAIVNQPTGGSVSRAAA